MLMICVMMCCVMNFGELLIIEIVWLFEVSRVCVFVFILGWVIGVDMRVMCFEKLNSGFIVMVCVGLRCILSVVVVVFLLSGVIR